MGLLDIEFVILGILYIQDRRESGRIQVWGNMTRIYTCTPIRTRCQCPEKVERVLGTFEGPRQIRGQERSIKQQEVHLNNSKTQCACWFFFFHNGQNHKARVNIFSSNMLWFYDTWWNKGLKKRLSLIKSRGLR